MNNIVKINDPEIGEIVICLKAMKSVSARWKQGVLYVNAPITLSLAQIQESIDKMRKRILEHRPIRNSLVYYDGMEIKCFNGITINIKSAIDNNSSIVGTVEDKELIIKVSHLLDYNDPEITNAISSMLSKMMSKIGAKYLIPHAKDLAKNLKLKPKGFIIGRGKQKLGHCTSNGEIQLSYYLMFLPDELVNYIICHELAHLTEMNHSDKFHSLCNNYCNGRESEYEKKLQAHNWCILKV